MTPSGSPSADQNSQAVERRRHPRQRLQSLSYVHLDEGNGGIILNLSESGLAVKAAVSVTEGSFPSVRIQIAQSSTWIETKARVTWSGESRRTLGIEFVDLAFGARAQIQEWLAAQADRGSFAADTSRDITLDEVFAREESIRPASQPPSSAPNPSTNPEPPQQLLSNAPAASSLEPAALVASLRDAVAHEHAHDHEHEAANFVGQALLGSNPPARASFLAQSTELDSLASNVSATTDTIVLPELSGSAINRTQLAPRPPSGSMSGPIFGSIAPPAQSDGSYAIVAALALLALIGGWFAGRSFFGNETTRPSISKATSTGDIAASVAPVTSFEAVDSANRRYVIPFAAPGGAAQNSQLPHSPADVDAQTAPSAAPESNLGYHVWTLSPPKTSSRAASAPPTDSVPPSFEAQSAASSPSGEVLPASIAGSTPNLAAPAPPATSSGTQPAVLIHTVVPVYPDSARQSHASGAVTLRLRVESDGRISNIRVTNGSPELSGAAIDAVRQWVYKPALLDGQPVAADVDAIVNFTPR